MKKRQEALSEISTDLKMVEEALEKLEMQYLESTNASGSSSLSNVGRMGY